MLQVADENALAMQVKALISNPQLVESLVERGYVTFEKNQGALNRLLAVIDSAMPTVTPPAPSVAEPIQATSSD